MRHLVSVLLLGVLGCPAPAPAPPRTWEVVAADQPEAYTAVQGTSANDVWVVGSDVGAGATALHFDGQRWVRHETGHRATLWWVHPFADGTAFFGGSSSTILRFDGTSFVRLQTPGLAGHTVFGLWGRAPEDVYAVGSVGGRNGFIWRFDGQRWRALEPTADVPVDRTGDGPGFFKVWGPASGSEVWVVGARGVVLHSRDGERFERVDSGTTTSLFTVHGTAEQVCMVGGGGTGGGLLEGNRQSLRSVELNEAPLLQGLWLTDTGGLASGQAGFLAERVDGVWKTVETGLSFSAESLHAVWVSPDDEVWSVGGNVISGTLDRGVIVRGARSRLTAEFPRLSLPMTADLERCPAAEVDPVPSGSLARRWNEQLLGAIRRDIPSPVVHARNLFHLSAAMWDAWAAFEPSASGYLVREKLTAPDVELARSQAISAAAFTLLDSRAAKAVGGPRSRSCYRDFLGRLGVSLEGVARTGNEPRSLGLRIAEAYIARGLADGSNEQNGYRDTTGWKSTNPPLVVEETGIEVADPALYQPLNLAESVTQNGIPIAAGVQGYIGAHWGLVTPFALRRRPGQPLYVDPGPPPGFDARTRAWAIEVLRRHAQMDLEDATELDISPAVWGNNALGSDDGRGHGPNPVTGTPYPPQRVKRADFARVVAEYWADGPRSETPPGHWNKLANDVSAHPMASRRLFGANGALAPLEWDVKVYFALNGALHDAAIAAWEVKRAFTAARPITLIRYMAAKGQSSDASLPAFDPAGLPLENGLVELITAESSGSGQRHAHLRRFIGKVAVRSWRGEPGDRAREVGGVGWILGTSWVPFQRRTFVTPAFPGFVSGHSTYSRTGAEVLAALTGSPFFPGGLAEFVAPQDRYLTFERGPSRELKLQWASYFDAADQAGQSRLWGGIHIEPDDFAGRRMGREVALQALPYARTFFDGTAGPLP
jgi:hypothetical protein